MTVVSVPDFSIVNQQFANYCEIRYLQTISYRLRLHSDQTIVRFQRSARQFYFYGRLRDFSANLCFVYLTNSPAGGVAQRQIFVSCLLKLHGAGPSLGSA